MKRSKDDSGFLSDLIDWMFHGGARSLLSDLREAVRGSQQDYTEGSIRKGILLLAVPMVLETVMESVFAVVDIFFVSRLGPDSMATVGLTEAMLTILYAVAIGLCMGATALVARRTGEKDPEGASIAAVQAIALGLALALVVGLAGGWFGGQMLRLMGAEQSVVDHGQSYTKVMFGGNVTIVLLFLINAIFRGVGDAAIAMRVLWLANAINIVLDPCLIFGLGPFPKLGIAGAAIATNIGRGSAVLYQIYTLTQKGGRIRIRKQHVKLDWSVMKRMIRISGTGMLQALVGMTSWLGLIRILSSFGSAAVAGYTVAIRIVIFALLPSWGMSNAAATLVGQNLGAGKPERAEESVWLTCRYNLIFLGIAGLLFVFLAEHLISIFTSDFNVAPYAVSCLRIISYGFLFYAYGMVLTQAFNGAGDTFTPTMINLFCFWLWEIPLGYFLAVHGKAGPEGVFWAVAVAFSTLAVVSAIVFKRGTWKNRQV